MISKLVKLMKIGEKGNNDGNNRLDNRTTAFIHHFETLDITLGSAISSMRVCRFLRRIRLLLFGAPRRRLSPVPHII